MMTTRRHTGLSVGTLRCFDAGSPLQSLVVTEEDTGSFLVPQSSLPPIKTSTHLYSPSTIAFVEQRIRFLLFIVFCLLPTLAIVVALSTWTYTSVQV